MLPPLCDVVTTTPGHAGEIRSRGGEPRLAALIAKRVHRLRNAARPHSRRALGVRSRVAAAPRVGGGQLEMQPQLLLEAAMLRIDPSQQLALVEPP